MHASLHLYYYNAIKVYVYMFRIDWRNWKTPRAKGVDPGGGKGGSLPPNTNVGGESIISSPQYLANFTYLSHLNLYYLVIK